MGSYTDFAALSNLLAMERFEKSYAGGAPGIPLFMQNHQPQDLMKDFLQQDDLAQLNDLEDTFFDSVLLGHNPYTFNPNNGALNGLYGAQTQPAFEPIYMTEPTAALQAPQPEDPAAAPAPQKRPGHKGPPAKYTDKKRISNREAAKRHRDKKKLYLQTLEHSASALREEHTSLKARLAGYGVQLPAELTEIPRAAAQLPAHPANDTGAESGDEEGAGAGAGDARSQRRRSGSEGVDSEQTKLERKRFLCALAAKKCRDKKKVYVASLEAEVRGLKGANAQLKARLTAEELARFAAGADLHILDF